VIGSDFVQAWKAVKEQRAREKALRRFVGKNPDYTTIEASIRNIALGTRTDILAVWTFPDGTKLEIKKADYFDRERDSMDPERRGAY